MNKETWDLKPIYNNKNLWYEDYERLSNILNNFKENKDFIKNGKTLYEMLENINKLERELYKCYFYAKLIKDSDGLNEEASKIFQSAETLISLYKSKTSFIYVVLKKLDKNLLNKLKKENPSLEEYKHYFDVLLKNKNHILSLKEEKIIADSKIIRDCGNKSFEILDYVDIKFKDLVINNKKLELNHSNYTLFIKDKDVAVRKKAFTNYHNFYKEHHNTINNFLLNDVKNDNFIAKTRKYKNSLTMALADDNIKPDVYKDIIESIHNNIGLFHEYLSLKKKANNLKEMHMYDLHLLSSKYEKKFTYEEAKNIVSESVKILGQDYYKNYQKAFNEKWIDPFYRKGKYSGAYSSGFYDTYPYIILNYKEDFRSIETLAHEMGHSMHSYYSRKYNKYQDSVYPVFLAEIASNVNEILLFNYMLNNAKNNEEKKFFLETILDSFKGSVFRQIQFAEFEMIIHDKIDNNISLSSKEVSDIYYELNKFYYGPEVISDDLIRYEYLRVPHFYFSFYVYKYATGLALAYIFANRILNNEENALENYHKFLKSGGQDYPLNILENCGIKVNKKLIDESMKIFKRYLEKYKDLIGDIDGR